MVWDVDSGLQSSQPSSPLPNATLSLRTVASHHRGREDDYSSNHILIIAIGNAEHLKLGIPVPERELNRQIDTAFAGTARSKVYWIESRTTLEVW